MNKNPEIPRLTEVITHTVASDTRTHPSPSSVDLAPALLEVDAAIPLATDLTAPSIPISPVTPTVLVEPAYTVLIEKIVEGVLQEMIQPMQTALQTRLTETARILIEQNVQVLNDEIQRVVLSTDLADAVQQAVAQAVNTVLTDKER